MQGKSLPNFADFRWGVISKIYMAYFYEKLNYEALTLYFAPSS